MGNIPSHGRQHLFDARDGTAELTLVNLVLWQLAAGEICVTHRQKVQTFFPAAWGITSMGSSFGVAFFWHFGKWVQRLIERRRSQHEASKKYSRHVVVAS